MRSVLLLYLRDYLHWDDDTSTAVYHAFTVLAYLFPLVGAIVADSYWGKYKTIIYLSVVYVFGHAVKTVGSIPYVPSQVAHAVLSMFGLFFIAVGTGGIKPCVSSFGGDQFMPGQSYIRKQFFSLFYFAINAGSLISTFVTPIFRADVNCYPNETGPEFDQCFALAFGVPGALMVVALILFIAGSRWYTIYPPEGSIFTKVCNCIYTACKNRWHTPNDQRNKEHWLEYADAPPKLIRDTKYVLRVLVLYIPLPFFWALFDQQGSRWTLQAIQTNGYLGTLLIKPDQVEVLNPLLIVTLIPIFEATLYPFLRHFNIPFPPLRRMTVGLVLAGLSFIAAAILQIEIDKTLTPLPKSFEFGVRFINSAPCNVTFTPDNAILPDITVQPNDISTIIFYHHTDTARYTYLTCSGETATIQTTAAKEQVVEFVVFGDQAQLVNKVPMVTHKSEDGGGRFSVLNLDPQQRDLVVVVTSVERGKYPERSTDVLYTNRSASIDVGYGFATITAYDKATFGDNDDTGSGGGGNVVVYTTDLYLDVGGVYSIVYNNGSTGFTNLDLNPNTISVAWMIPQFLIITIGEVFLSITGLEFSYTQAPPSMKSVLTSIWLFTVSLGNIIVLIIAEAKGIEKQSDEFFLFAGLIFVAAILFVFLAYRYIPVDENEFKEEILEEERKFRERARLHELKKKGIPLDDISDGELPSYDVAIQGSNGVTKKLEYEHDTPM
ncbi:solute carrier family 15 member 2-like isoform X2 [Ciona intestinalis]